MIDRLKLRCFDTENKEMIYGHFPFEMLSTIASRRDGAEFDNLIFMQSPGRKDKNGKLAFEGDIFQWDYDGKQYTQELIFSEYDDNEGYRVDKHLGWGFSSATLPDVIGLGGVVIGNIHQDQELLNS